MILFLIYQLIFLNFSSSNIINPNSQADCGYQNWNITDKNFQFISSTKCASVDIINAYFEYLPENLFTANPLAHTYTFRHTFVSSLTFANLPGLSNLKYLSIVNSTVSLIPNDAFTTSNVIKYISIVNSTILKVEGKPFNNLKNLRKLEVIISDVNEEFMKILDLNHEIEKFSCKSCDLNAAKMFKIVKNMKIKSNVDLSNNLIEHFRGEVHPKSLIMINNRLTDLFNTYQIKELSLRDNKITVLLIQGSTRFLDAKNNSISELRCGSVLVVKELYLDDNKLSTFKCISSMNSLEILNINSNNFEHILPEWFENLQNLKCISALNNQLSNYDPIMFMASRNNNIVQIYVNKFNYGYENLKYFYPKLKEVVHDKLTTDCDEYFENIEATKKQKIALIYHTLANCTFLIGITK